MPDEQAGTGGESEDRGVLTRPARPPSFEWRYGPLPDQIADVFTAMEHDAGLSLEGLKADGGASSNDFLMQLQADVLDRPVTRGNVAEIGIRGVSAMALAYADMTGIDCIGIDWTYPREIARDTLQSRLDAGLY